MFSVRRGRRAGSLRRLAADRRRDRVLRPVQGAARRRRDPGGDLRFQVGLPFPSSAMNAFKADFAADYPKAEAGYEDLVARELPRLFDAIPPEDLAIQWDCAYETQDIEGVLAWTERGRLGALRRTGHAPDAADPGGDAGRLPPLLRHLPRVADVRGPRLPGAGADGQLRRGTSPGARSTGCTWPARATCAARTDRSSARWSTSSLATPASSSESCFRSTARRGCAVGTDRLALPR